MKLNPDQKKQVLERIEDVFQKMKARLLGKHFKGNRIYFEVVRQSDPLATIEGVFRYSSHMMYGPAVKVDEHQVESLAEITGNYIEAKKLQLQNVIMNEIAQAETVNQALNAIRDHLGKATNYMEGLVSNEVRTAQAYADRDGITQVAASMGVDDPTVVKFGKVDDKLCDICKELWHDPVNPAKPRPWKLSELVDGYMTDRKNPFATSGPSHPRCRHILSLCSPNMGFNNSGVIEWRGFGYDYYEDYYGNSKKKKT